MHLVGTNPIKLVALAVFVVAGCAPSGDSESLDVGLEVSDFASLDPRALNARGAELEAAFQDALGECLRAEGFEYVTVVGEQAEVAEAAGFIEQRGGNSLEARFPGLDAARVDGFQKRSEWLRRAEAEFLGEATGAQDEDPNIAYLDGLDAANGEAYSEVRFGDGGCEDQADQASGTAEFFELTDTASVVSAAAFERLEADNDVLARTEAWTGCMYLAGFQGLAGPFDVFGATDRFYADALSALGASPVVSRADINAAFDQPYKEETALAVSTATCEQETGVIELAARTYERILAEELEARGLR